MKPIKTKPKKNPATRQLINNHSIPEESDSTLPDSTETLFSALISMMIHQDSLLWSRVQILIAIQGAVITGSYILRGSIESKLLLISGFIFTCLLHLLVTKDQKDRDANRELVDELGFKLIPKNINNEIYKKYKMLKYIPFSTDFKFMKIPIKGGFIIGLVLKAFAIADIILLIVYWD